jgi:NAD(P)-dependent dehydrogenase (short-subunit alcohol dehydrogenase family)
LEQLHEKTVLVTGSTDGVGRLVARRLGEAGARVLVHGRDTARGAQVVSEIQKAGSSATFFRADLASLAEVRRLAAVVQDATDRLNILINNAGIGTAGAVRQESADGYELRLAVNYLSGFC